MDKTHSLSHCARKKTHTPEVLAQLSKQQDLAALAQERATQERQAAAIDREQLSKQQDLAALAQERATQERQAAAIHRERLEEGNLENRVGDSGPSVAANLICPSSSAGGPARHSAVGGPSEPRRGGGGGATGDSGEAASSRRDGQDDYLISTRARMNTPKPSTARWNVSHVQALRSRSCAPGIIAKMVPSQGLRLVTRRSATLSAPRHIG
jgi:hypothetical protein